MNSASTSSNPSSLSTTLPDSFYTTLETELGTGAPAHGNVIERFFRWIQTVSFTSWILFLMVMSFLGVNVLMYLAKGSEQVASVVNPIVGELGRVAGLLTGQVVDVAAEGGKSVTDASAGIIDESLSQVQDITPGGLDGNAQAAASESVPSGHNAQAKARATSAIDLALENTVAAVESNQGDYSALEANSSLHESLGAGWCYIGTDRSHRACAKVGLNDTCMSGNIFPSQDICVNPSLRS